MGTKNFGDAVRKAFPINPLIIIAVGIIVVAVAIVRLLPGLKEQSVNEPSASIEDEPRYTGSLSNPALSSEEPMDTEAPGEIESNVPVLIGIDWDRPDYSEVFVNWIVDFDFDETTFSEKCKVLPYFGNAEEFSDEISKYFKDLEDVLASEDYYSNVTIKEPSSLNERGVLQGENTALNSRVTVSCGRDGSQQISWSHYENPQEASGLNMILFETMVEEVRNYMGVRVDQTLFSGLVECVLNNVYDNGVMFAEVRSQYSDVVIHAGVEAFGTDMESWSFGCSRMFSGPMQEELE